MKRKSKSASREVVWNLNTPCIYPVASTRRGDGFSFVRDRLACLE